MLRGEVETLFSTNVEGAIRFIRNKSNQIVVASEGQLSIIEQRAAAVGYEVESIQLRHNKKSVVLDDVLLSPGGDIIGVDWDNGLYNIGIDRNDIQYSKLTSISEINKKFRYNTGYIDSSGVLWVGTRHGGLCR